MATIERGPLPPLGSSVTSITEADRAEMIAHANNVIDHYLNGAGSYWDEGPRKPLEDTVGDLRGFRAQVNALRQLADDPGRILDSIDELVGGAIGGVEQAIEYRDGRDDKIMEPLPETNDRIRGYREPTSARTGISYADREQAALPQAAPHLGLVSGKPMPFYTIQPPIWNFK